MLSKQLWKGHHYWGQVLFVDVVAIIEFIVKTTFSNYLICFAVLLACSAQWVVYYLKRCILFHLDHRRGWDIFHCASCRLKQPQTQMIIMTKTEALCFEWGLDWLLLNPTHSTTYKQGINYQLYIFKFLIITNVPCLWLFSFQGQMPVATWYLPTIKILYDGP